VAFSTDGQTLASASWDQAVRLWNTTTGHAQPFYFEREKGIVESFKPHEGIVRSVAFNPNGSMLATAGEQGLVPKTGNVSLWEVEKKRDGTWVVKLSVSKRVKDVVNTVAFSPDGKTLAYGSGDRYSKSTGELIVWDHKNDREIYHTNLSGGAVTSLAFSPAGKQLAFWTARLVTHDSIPGELKLWDLESNQGPVTLQQHAGGVSSTAFSSDGKTLASGGGDETVKLWDVKTGREFAVLKGHRDRVISVTFSPDGKTLATGSIDQTVRLWRSATDEQVILFFERLAKQEPEEIQWQIDIALACWHVKGRERLEQGRDILRRLENLGKLNQKQIEWIEMFDQALK
jgi:WD40 repeat protein